jgi:ligand-binding sensor domain-containing protein
LWIGTGAFGLTGAGLNQFDRAEGKFTRYTHNPLNAKTIAGDNVSSIVEAPDGALWIGTGGFSLEGAGLDRLDPQTGTITHFKHDEAIPDSLSADAVMDLVADDSGDLWISAWGGGLNRMSFDRPGYFDHYRHDPYFPESLSGDEAWTLLMDRSGMLWIGTAHSGLNQLPANTGQFQLYRHSPDNSHSVSEDAIGAFAEDTRGDIWIATWSSGLDRFDPHTGQFEHVVANPDDVNSLSSNMVMSVYADPQDVIVWTRLRGK